MKIIQKISKRDVEIISEKTGYKESTIRAILSGRRRKIKRNEVVFEIASELRHIRMLHEKALERDLEKLKKK